MSHRLLRLALLALFLTQLAILAQPVGSQPRPREQTFEANFNDVEIKDFLKTMAQITRRNILVDDAVKGKITIVSHRPIPRSRALDFMRQVLEVKGYGLIEDGDLLRVVPIDVARDASQPADRDPVEGEAGVVSRVIQLPGGVSLTEMANLLRQIAGKNTLVIPYPPSNTLVITGYAVNVRRAVEVMKEVMNSMRQGDGGVASTESVHIYRARNMTAESLANVLTRLDTPVGSADPAAPGAAPGTAPPAGVPPSIPRPAGGKIRAVAHKESNSIVVTATSAEWSEIVQIIERLDKERKQILLEVLIAEVTSSSLNDFGIDWRAAQPNAPYGQFNTGLAVEGNLLDSEGQITGNNTLNGFSLGFLRQSGDLLAILNANMNNRNFNVLSSPQVLTLDNQEAEINVGQDVPVRTQERTSGGGNAEATVNSFEYRPSGIKLKFTPYVNAEGQIGLDLFSEVTSIEGGASSTTNPTFNKRNIKTFVTVQDQQTIVIGGLVFTEKLQEITKIPLLGDIPLLGHLFRRNTERVRRTNLMLFITPHILDNREEADRITEYKREEQSRQIRERHNDIILWPEQSIDGGRQEDFDRIEDDLEH
ncbi:MAG: type II secretion system protein GspD [Leptospirales bacterium]|nr:type II secretion system protein GspD [Leptospirales bacterium]